MPFGLTNAPAAFQRLMQQLLLLLNPKMGAEFVNVYVDDVIVFSSSLEDHLEHLRKVVSKLMEAGLKLKPSKCHFTMAEVEYLGFLVTPAGLKQTNWHVKTVEEFPVPTSLKALRQFMGLASYYQKFIPQFTKVAHPLQSLSRKDVTFHWTSECQAAFEDEEQTHVSPCPGIPRLSQGLCTRDRCELSWIGCCSIPAVRRWKAKPSVFCQPSTISR